MAVGDGQRVEGHETAEGAMADLVNRLRRMREDPNGSRLRPVAFLVAKGAGSCGQEPAPWRGFVLSSAADGRRRTLSSP